MHEGSQKMKKYNLKLCNYEEHDKDLNCQYQQYKLDQGYVMIEGYKWIKRNKIKSRNDDMLTLTSGQVVQLWLECITDDHLHYNCPRDTSKDGIRNRILEIEESHKVNGGTHSNIGQCPTCQTIEKLAALLVQN